MNKTVFFSLLLAASVAALAPCATTIYVGSAGEGLFSPGYGWNVNAESIRFSTVNPEHVTAFNEEGKILYAITRETNNNREQSIEGKVLVKPYSSEREIDFTLMPENKVSYCGDEWALEFVDETLQTGIKNVSGEFIRVESATDYAFGFDNTDSASHFYVQVTGEGAPVYYPSAGTYLKAENNNVNYLGCCEHSCEDEESGCKGIVLDAENKCVNGNAYRYACSLNACVPTVEECGSCENGECTAPPQEPGKECTDSDNGIRPFEKGVANGNGDACDGLDVIEWHCEAGEATSTLIQCEHGCANGACKEEPSCIQGAESVLYDGEEFAPYCSTEGLVEYSCNGNALQSKVTPCKCVDGECMEQPEKKEDYSLQAALAITALLAAAYVYYAKPFKKTKKRKKRKK
jgi:hypothetical protein